MVKNIGKEEKQRIKQLNRSLVGVPRGTAQILGISAIQPIHAVYRKGSQQYIKIYSVGIDHLSTEEVKLLVRQISALSNNSRFRITSFVGDHGTTHFFSLFVLAPDYAAAHQKYCEFETKMQSDMGIRITGVKIVVCALEDVIQFVRMNFHVQLKSLKEDWGQVLFQAVDVQERFLTILPEELKCCCYFGKNYLGENKNFRKEILASGCQILSCIDVQELKDGEKTLLNKTLAQKYAASIEANAALQITYNLSYLLCIQAPEEVHSQMETQIMKLARENGILLENCSNMQMQAYMSMCTLGICDYKNMENASENVVSELLI